MTSKELLTYCRTRLDDLTGSPTDALFSDNELYSYLSDCQEKVAMECLVIRDSSTVAVCTLDVLAGDNSVVHHPSILRFDRVSYVQGSVRKFLHKMNSDTELLDPPTGDPERFSPSCDPGYLTFDKRVSDDAVISVRVRRLPLNSITATLQPEIPVGYRRKLVNGVLGLAFMKPETETYNAQKAQGYLALFAEDREQIKRAETRLHGIGARFK